MPESSANNHDNYRSDYHNHFHPLAVKPDMWRGPSASSREKPSVGLSIAVQVSEAECCAMSPKRWRATQKNDRQLPIRVILTSLRACSAVLGAIVQMLSQGRTSLRSRPGLRLCRAGGRKQQKQQPCKAIDAHCCLDAERGTVVSTWVLM